MYIYNIYRYIEYDTHGRWWDCLRVVRDNTVNKWESQKKKRGVGSGVYLSLFKCVYVCLYTYIQEENRDIYIYTHIYICKLEREVGGGVYLVEVHMYTYIYIYIYIYI